MKTYTKKELMDVILGHLSLVDSQKKTFEAAREQGLKEIRSQWWKVWLWRHWYGWRFRVKWYIKTDQSKYDLLIKIMKELNLIRYEAHARIKLDELHLKWEKESKTIE